VKFVPDASVTMTWCFEDEKTELTEGLLEALADGAEAMVPGIWVHEVANAVAGALRRGRITGAAGASFIEDVQGLPIQVDGEGERRVFEAVFQVACQHGLTVYDAAYLELAMRRGLPLATLDERLERAAREAGVEVVGAGEERHRGRG
jgi:predicted nucleic acid-binding protein